MSNKHCRYGSTLDTIGVFLEKIVMRVYMQTLAVQCPVYVVKPILSANLYIMITFESPQ